MPTVCLDFDGVLAQYEGWKAGEIGDPLEAGVELARLLKESGFSIVIHTCRLHPENGIHDSQLEKIKTWLRNYKIPFDRIETQGKPIAMFYVDDRAIRFEQRLAKFPRYAEFLLVSMLDIMEEELKR